MIFFLHKINKHIPPLGGFLFKNDIFVYQF